MPFTNTIVEFINDHLKQGMLNRKDFQPAKFFGVASAIQFQTDEPERPLIAPGVTGIDGEIEDATPDDLFSLMVYHKIVGNQYSVQKKDSYGDEYDIVSTSEMQLFVFAQSDKIRMSAESLEPFFVFGMPGRLSGLLMEELKIKSAAITVLSSDMDKLRNFRSEYQNVKFNLAPEHIFFSIRYQIKKVFDRRCVDACTCN